MNDSIPLPQFAPSPRKNPAIVINEAGGKQCETYYRLDLIPPICLLLLGACLGRGSRRYGDNNWLNIPIQDNLNHALIHINLFMAGDRSEPHLVHALCRIVFALYQAVSSGAQPVDYVHPDDVNAA